ncbi:MAG: DUF1579 family protein [Anaerolineales bacterium]
MGDLNSLIRHTGKWKGVYRLWLSPSEAAHESETTASITPLIGGKFARIDYTWAADGEPQAGSLLFGYEAKAALATAVWIDSWHMGDKFMISQGTLEGEKAVVVRGSYAVESGPDWGWRTVIESGEVDSFRVVMYNVSPDGQEALAVAATYTRAQ